MSVPASHDPYRHYPEDIDLSRIDEKTADFFLEFFKVKGDNHDIDGFLGFFAPDLYTYTDATLGWTVDSHAALTDTMHTYMPKWGSGTSYATRMLGGPRSAVVAMTDTPELFGGEIRALGAVDIEDGKVVRWVDYWDSSEFPTAVYDQVRVPAAHFPQEYRGDALKDRADEAMEEAISAFHAAMQHGADANLGDVFCYDVVIEDMTLRTQISGRTAATGYLQRAWSTLPYGEHGVLVRCLGGNRGGGFEWVNHEKGIRGITAVELDKAGKISRMTTVYDGRLVANDERNRLVSVLSSSG